MLRSKIARPRYVEEVDLTLHCLPGRRRGERQFPGESIESMIMIKLDLYFFGGGKDVGISPRKYEEILVYLVA